MADAIVKALKKLSPKQQKIFKNILTDIQNRSFDTYDIKQLKGRKDIFRIRKGSYRIIFLMDNQNIQILALEKRGDTTY